MRTYQPNHIKKTCFAFLWAVFLNFEGNCANEEDAKLAAMELGSAKKDRSAKVDMPMENMLKDLVRDEISESTRKAIPNMTGFLSLSLGSISFLGSLSAEAVKVIGTTGSCINILGATSNIYNWYKDNGSMEPGWHKLAHGTLNGLVVLSNLGSASLGFTSVYSDDPYTKNACGVASLVVGASGLFFKGIDLFLTKSPADNHKCKMERRRSGINS